MSRRNCLPNNKVEGPIPSTWDKKKERESRQRRFRRACHVSRGAAPCWDDHQQGTTFLAAKIRTLSLSAQHALSLFWHCASCCPVASPAPLPFHVRCRYWDGCLDGPKTRPSSRSRQSPTLCRTQPAGAGRRSVVGSTRCSCRFAGRVPRDPAFLLPALEQFHLSDHSRARTSFRCQQAPSPLRLLRLSLPCRPRGSPRNTPWAVVRDPITSGGRNPGVTPRKRTPCPPHLALGRIRLALAWNQDRRAACCRRLLITCLAHRGQRRKQTQREGRTRPNLQLSRTSAVPGRGTDLSPDARPWAPGPGAPVTGPCKDLVVRGPGRTQVRNGRIQAVGSRTPI
jgi:hypothetical protein